MADVIQVLRSSEPGRRPAERAPGELFVNFADGVFGYIDQDGNAVDYGGSGGTELPADAAGVLTNDGSGALSWEPVDTFSGDYADLTGAPDLSVYFPFTGGTLTGPLTLSGAPTEDLHAATKAYVDANSGGGGGGSVDLTADYDWTGTHTFNLPPLRKTSAEDYTAYSILASGYQEIKLLEAHRSGDQPSVEFIGKINYDTSGGYAEIRAQSKNVVSGTEEKSQRAVLILDGASSSNTNAILESRAGSSVDNRAAIRCYSQGTYSTVLIYTRDTPMVSFRDSIYGFEILYYFPITLPTGPTDDLHAANKAYVDTAALKTLNLLVSKGLVTQEEVDAL